ncbi:unnamed protein product [Effrenium voratum]|nr:unnamed protein product [Effrenium voratum]
MLNQASLLRSCRPTHLVATLFFARQGVAAGILWMFKAASPIGHEPGRRLPNAAPRGPDFEVLAMPLCRNQPSISCRKLRLLVGALGIGPGAQEAAWEEQARSWKRVFCASGSGGKLPRCNSWLVSAEPRS